MAMPASCLRASLLLLGALCVLATDGHATGFLIATPAPQGPSTPRPWRLESEQVEAVVSEPNVRVTVTQVFRNLTDSRLDVRYIFPLPQDVVLSGVTVFENGQPLTGRLLKAEAARAAYEEILRSQRDAALVCHYGKDLYEVRAAPLPPNSTGALTLKYDQLLRTDAGVTEWTHAASGAFAGPADGIHFSLRLDMKIAGRLGPLYCPSYDVRIDRGYGGTLSASLSTRLRADDPEVALYWSGSGKPGDIKPALPLSVGTTLMTYWPQEEAQGYFLLLAEPSRGAAVSRTIRPKIIHFVVDTSGSMAGEKLAQVKAALRQVIASLNPKDRFNVVAYNSVVTSLWESPQVFTAESMRQAFTFVERLRTSGGTHIEAALTTVLGVSRDPDVPAAVVFLTDGRPTFGEVDTGRILEKVRLAQPARKTRIFSLGVGVDVNSVLLDRLALESHGVPEYVRPREDVERKVALLYEKIRYPILSDVECDFGSMAAADVLPETPADLFRGSRVVLSGRYGKGGQVELVIRGRDGALMREYHYALQAAERGQGVLHDFPARIWAIRRVALLIDAIRLHRESVPKLVDEIAGLSRRFGIVTEYTLYLAGDALGGRSQSRDRDETLGLLRVQTPQAVGNVAWAQSKNQTLRRGATGVPRRERELFVAGANDRDVETLDLGERPGVWPRIVSNRTFYFRRDRGWVDAKIEDPAKVDKKVHRWSSDFFEILRSADSAVKARLAQDGDVLLRIGERTVHLVDGR